MSVTLKIGDREEYLTVRQLSSSKLFSSILQNCHSVDNDVEIAIDTQFWSVIDLYLEYISVSGTQTTTITDYQTMVDSVRLAIFAEDNSYLDGCLMPQILANWSTFSALLYESQLSGEAQHEVQLRIAWPLLPDQFKVNPKFVKTWMQYNCVDSTQPLLPVTIDKVATAGQRPTVVRVADNHIVITLPNRDVTDDKVRCITLLFYSNSHLPACYEVGVSSNVTDIVADSVTDIVADSDSDTVTDKQTWQLQSELYLTKPVSYSSEWFVEDGLQRLWYNNGQLQLVQEMQNGRLHGGFENYDRDGKLLQRGQYEKTSKIGQWTEFSRDDGCCYLTGNYVGGRKNGIWTAKDAYGNILFRLSFTAGRRGGRI